MRGRDGRVALTIEAEDGARRIVPLTRSRALASRLEQGPNHPVWQFVGFYAFEFIAALGLIAGGLMLIERRPEDPVSVLLAFAFVLGSMALPLTAVVGDWLGWGSVTDLTTAGFFALLLVVLPAFPDGRFVPRAGFWLALAAPLLFVMIAINLLPLELVAAITMVAALVAASIPVLRFRRTPPGIERQQLKWAGLGFAGAFVVQSIAMLLAVLRPGGPAGAWIGWAALAIFSLAFLILPAGVLVSLLRFRLWDADRAIGRSSMVGIVTLTLGGVWAGAQELAKIGVSQLDPDFDPGVIAAISTALIAILFPPVQSRVERWTEKRLEPRLERLRTLPDLLSAMAGRSSVAQLAEAVMAAATDGAAATGGTLTIVRGGRSFLVAARGEIQHGPDVEVVGGEAVLALGPRPDGSPLPGGVRALLSELSTPMAEAFGEALAREDQARAIARLGERIDDLAQRLTAIERDQASSPRTSSMKRITEMGLET
jgi:hypothetical protein